MVISMNYTLMHKDIMVANLTIDSVTSVISSIAEVYHSEHIPIGISVKKGKVDRGELNKWWISRAIPASRMGIKDVMDTLKIGSTTELLDKAYGLSLSDQYWIKPYDSDMMWSNVNFFDNKFSDDMGNVLFGEGTDSEVISLLSPDNTSDGWLKKKWKIIDGERVLIKSGSNPFQQEPYNEVIASAICRRLGIYHVPYHVIVEGEYPFSICPNFVTKDTELISAWNIYQTQKKSNHVSVYRHYIDCATRLGIPNVEQAVNQMIVLDYLIDNEDRHLNNFGVLRDVNTLEYIGAAPIFDSGTSLGFNKTVGMINKGTKTSCKPFKNTHEEQIKLVTSFDFFEPMALLGIEDEMREIMENSQFIEESRILALCSGVRKRIEQLTEFSLSHINEDDIRADVCENVSYSGK